MTNKIDPDSVKVVKILNEATALAFPDHRWHAYSASVGLNPQGKTFRMIGRDHHQDYYDSQIPVAQFQMLQKIFIQNGLGETNVESPRARTPMSIGTASTKGEGARPSISDMDPLYLLKISDALKRDINALIVPPVAPTLAERLAPLTGLFRRSAKSSLNERPSDALLEYALGIAQSSEDRGYRAYHSFINMDFTGTEAFCDRPLENISFKGSVLKGSNFINTEIISDHDLANGGASFEDTDLSDANFRGAKINATMLNAVMDNTDLRGADLSRARNLTVGQLAKARLNEKTILPDYIKAEIEKIRTYSSARFAPSSRAMSATPT